MKPDDRFLLQPKYFWANVRTVSQKIGYSDRKTKEVRVPTIAEIVAALESLGLSADHVLVDGEPTKFGSLLHEYYVHRANMLNTYVEPRLMDVDRARQVFHDLRALYQPTIPLPMNKQKKEKRDYAFLTGLVNMLIDAHADGLTCDYDPQQLTTVTREGVPLRTLARRVDGAFPSTVNPHAIWEIKEYYYTKTFGSRVADGVYESLLDGMELEELREHEGVDVKHYLMVDSRHTWWICGKPYLCRIVDMLHMGYVDEVLFGYEVVERLPDLVGEWIAALRD